LKLNDNELIKKFIKKTSALDSKSPRVGVQATSIEPNYQPKSSRNIKIPTLAKGNTTQRRSIANDAKEFDNLVIGMKKNFSPNRTGGLTTQRMSQTSI